MALEELAGNLKEKTEKVVDKTTTKVNEKVPEIENVRRKIEVLISDLDEKTLDLRTDVTKSTSKALAKLEELVKELNENISEN